MIIDSENHDYVAIRLPLIEAEMSPEDFATYKQQVDAIWMADVDANAITTLRGLIDDKMSLYSIPEPQPETQPHICPIEDEIINIR